MKAKRVKGLDPEAPLADNAERIVRVRLDELTSFMPKAADPDEVVALHDMRIAAKRLRYILEVTGDVFGPYAANAVKMVKDLQDLLGDIHDCDVQLPEVAAFLEELVAEDVASAGASPRTSPRRRTAAPTPGWSRSRSICAPAARALFEQFLELWRDYERKGFAARLAFALSERSQSAVS